MDCQLLITPSGRLTVRETEDANRAAPAESVDLAKVVRLFTVSIPAALFKLAAERVESVLAPELA